MRTSFHCARNGVFTLNRVFFISIVLSLSVGTVWTKNETERESGTEAESLLGDIGTGHLGGSDDTNFLVFGTFSSQESNQNLDLTQNFDLNLNSENENYYNNTEESEGNRNSSTKANATWTEKNEDEQDPYQQQHDFERRTVNKCCPFNQKYDQRKGKCVEMEEARSSGGRSSIGSNSVMMMMMTNISSGFNLHDFENGTDSIPEDSILFELKISKPNCYASEITEKIIHMDKIGQQNHHKPSVHGILESSSLILTTLGYLIWQDEFGLMNTVPYSDFCMDQINQTAFVALFCKPTCTDKKPCIRKCCNPESVLDLNSQKCVVNKNQWTPRLYTSKGTPIKNDTTRQPYYSYGYPNCNAYSISPREDSVDRMYTLVNGSFVTISNGRKIVFSPDIYCVDGTINGSDWKATNRSETSAGEWNGWSEMDQIALICYPDLDNHDEEPHWKFVLYATGAFTSVFFLALTAIVYLILWEHQNIHGWLQFAYVVSCLHSYLFLGVLQLASEAIHEYNLKLCETMGSVIHFSFLSAFFWMTSMNFDLWWTFSGCRPLRTGSKVGEIRRFCLFALFSWGSAGIIAGTGLTLDYWYKDVPDSSIRRPRFGERKCYFFGYEEQLPYFYGPLGVLLIIDLIFFLSTVYSLHKLQQDTRFATQQSSRQEKKKFVLFVKLFVVMGVLWIFEVFSWAATTYNPENKQSWDIVFVIFDFINASQGVLIFIIFTCKPNTCRQLEGQFKKLTVFLEGKRDNGVGHSILSKVIRCFKIATIALILPVFHLFRNIFSFCGRRRRSLNSRRHPSHTTTMTSTFDKFRKASDTSTTTSLSIKDPGVYELDITSLHM